MDTNHTTEARNSTAGIAIVVILLLILGWQTSQGILDYFMTLSTFTIMTVAPFEMIQSRFSISVVFALVVALPYIYIELYRFVTPGLYQNESKILKWSTIPFFAMFLSGVVFALKVFLPIVMVYVNEFYIVGVQNSVTLSNYVSFLLSSMILFGVVFCVPVVLAILSYAGIIDHRVMSTYRRHVYICLLLCGAVITPPDAFTQLLVAVPLVVLYESSICVSWIINFNRVKNEVSTNVKQ